MECSVADGGSHSVHYNWDFAQSTGGVCSNDNVTPCTVANEAADCGGADTCLIAPETGPWHPVKGAFEIAFWALGSNTSGGTPQVTVALSRTGGTNVNNTITLNNDGNWHQYVYNFTGTDTDWVGGGALASLNFTLTATNNSAKSGAAIYVDDVYLGKTETAATGFRDEMVTTLQAINPGSIRLMEGGTMGAPRVHSKGSAAARPDRVRARILQAPATSSMVLPTLPTLMVASGPIRQRTCIRLRISSVRRRGSRSATLSATPTSRPSSTMPVPRSRPIPTSRLFGSSRATRNGTSVVRASASGTARAICGGYGAEAGRNFSIMSTEAASQCPSLASKIHYVIGNQACNAGVVGTAMQGASAAGYPDSQHQPVRRRRRDLLCRQRQQRGLDERQFNRQAAAYANAFFGFVPPYLGPQGTGCINNGGGGDWAIIGSNNTISVYETGPTGYQGPRDY